MNSFKGERQEVGSPLIVEMDGFYDHVSTFNFILLMVGSEFTSSKLSYPLNYYPLILSICIFASLHVVLSICSTITCNMVLFFSMNNGTSLLSN